MVEDPKTSQLQQLVRKCREVRTSLVGVLIRHAYFRARGKRLFTSNRVEIHGLKNISIREHLTIGLNHYGFISAKEHTFLNVEGELLFNGSFAMAKGCRIEVGQKAKVEFGNGYMSPNSDIIIVHGMQVGDGCAISWGSQFLDDNFHDLSYKGRRKVADPRIRIGSNVWIGCRVSVFRGAVIPDGCVVAANSVVSTIFTEENCLLAGNPAKIVRRGVSWK